MPELCVRIVRVQNSTFLVPAYIEKIITSVNGGGRKTGSSSPETYWRRRRRFSIHARVLRTCAPPHFVSILCRYVYEGCLWIVCATDCYYNAGPRINCTHINTYIHTCTPKRCVDCVRCEWKRKKKKEKYNSGWIHTNNVYTAVPSVHYYYYFYTVSITLYRYVCVCRRRHGAQTCSREKFFWKILTTSHWPRATVGRALLCARTERVHSIIYWKPSSAIVTWYLHYHGSHSLSEFYYNRFFFYFFFPFLHARTALRVHNQPTHTRTKFNDTSDNNVSMDRFFFFVLNLIRNQFFFFFFLCQICIAHVPILTLSICRYEKKTKKKT